MVRTAVNTVAAMTLMTGLLSCAGEKLKPLEEIRANEIYPLVTLKSDFCTLDADAVKSRLKFIFIVDKSGSNQTFGSELGTDPDGHRRYDALIRFMDQAPQDTTVSYSLINFSTAATQPSNGQGFLAKADFRQLIVDEKFDGGCPQVPDALQAAGCPSDGGWTDYKKAFEKANEIITADIEAAKLNQTEIVASNYVIFFVTDGAPIIDEINGLPVYQSTIDILGRVDGLKALEFGENRDYVENLQVHSLYYYNADRDLTAIDLLNQIAVHGEGEFYEVSAGQLIDFNRFSVPIRRVKHSLRDVFAQNLNTVWWNGILLRDSDADGLPDLIELELGSNPAVADSDGNGVRDGVEYKLFSKPCKDSHCSVAGAEAFLSCNSLRQTGLPNGAIYGDLDRDTLNDCEEKILGSIRTNFDSNGDWIPDELAFANGVSFVQGQTERDLDPDSDNVSNYQEIKENTPTMFPNSRVINLKKYTYNLTMTSNSPTQSCFHLEVKDISVGSNADLIRLTVVENTSVIDDKRFIRTAEKRASGDVVNFSEGDLR
jgi:hypothetical protein